MKLRATFTALITAMLLSESAAALSCMRPDLARTMEQAKKSDTVYYVLVGRFHTAPAISKPKPQYGNHFQQLPTTVRRSRFEGFSLGRNRREDVPLSNFPIDVEVSCAASWCGSPPPDNTQMIAFVEERRGQAPVLRMSACPGNTFNITRGDGQVRKMRTCLDNTCESDQPDYWK